MLIPEEFKAMLGRLDCNAEYLIDYPEALISRASRVASPEQRRTVKTFLDEFLRNNPSDLELHKLWFSGPIEIGYKDQAYLRQFFELMRDRL